jgi:hypothetical protein
MSIFIYYNYNKLSTQILFAFPIYHEKFLDVAVTTKECRLLKKELFYKVDFFTLILLAFVVFFGNIF